MGSIPVAKPTPLRSWHFSRRVIPLALLGLAALAVAGVILAVSWPSPEASSVVFAGKVNDLPQEEPVYNDAGFFLVKLESGEVIALSDVDPYRGFPDHDCRITWRPLLVFDRQAGWLRGNCTGSNFTITGDKMSGPSSRGMDRFPVTVDDSGGIAVDTSVKLCAPDYDVCR